MMEEQIRRQQQQQERDVIDKFFQEAVPKVLGVDTRCDEASCIDFARQLLHTHDIEAVPNQGSNSFTLICDSKTTIIQFRLKPFNGSITHLAHEIYGSQVPKEEFHGGFPLPVYTTTVIPGRVHILQKFGGDIFPLDRQLRTVKDLAIFIARATYFTAVSTEASFTYSETSWTATAEVTVKKLQNNPSLRLYAPELVSIVDGLHAQLGLLSRLPPVLTHNDLAEVNIMVNDAGDVTGILDFDAAGIEAFGMCIWGLYECFFGMMEEGKWSFYTQLVPSHGSQEVKAILETAFWNALWENIAPKFSREELESAVVVALKVGIINRYFIRGMLDHIDMAQSSHRISLEYARGILLGIE